MKLVDRFLEGVAADEPHGVIRPAVGVAAQAVDRNDARVLQSPGDLGLKHEPLPAGRIIGMAVVDLLQRHLAVQLGVQGDEDGAESALGMGAEDAEPLPVGGGRADGIAPVRSDSLPRTVASGAEPTVPWVASRSGPPRSTLSGVGSGCQGGEAVAGVAAKDLDMQAGDGLDGGAAGASRCARSIKWSARG